MNQKKNGGFTLIELLAVIVILAIIALIAVPVIMNIISKANESAFKDTAYGIISAGELYFAERQLEPNGMLEDVTFNLPDTTKTLQLKGEVPNGSILITKEGKVAIAVQNGRYCVTKGIEDKDVTITEDYKNCDLPNMMIVNGPMSSVDECIKNGVCNPGTEVDVQVNSSQTYKFYVISDTGSELTLIMDRNIYSNDDLANGSHNVAWDESGWANTNNGPATALAALRERTNSWTNIPEREYTYKEESSCRYYSEFTETMRAKLLTHTEVNDIVSSNNSTMPSWMYINLKNTGDNNSWGYWTSSVVCSMVSYGDYAYYVGYDGYIYDKPMNNSNNYGVRPVITLTK